MDRCVEMDVPAWCPRCESRVKIVLVRGGPGGPRPVRIDCDECDWSVPIKAPAGRTYKFFGVDPEEI